MPQRSGASSRPRDQGVETDRNEPVRDAAGGQGPRRGKRVGSLYHAGVPRRAAAPTKRGKRCGSSGAYTKDRTVTLRGHRVPPDHERNPQSRRLGGVPRRRRRGAELLVAGRRRRAGAEIFPQGRRAGAPEEGRGRDRSRPGCGARPPTRGARRQLPGEGAQHRRALRQAGVRAARRHLDLLGLEGRLFRLARRTRAPSSTSSSTCWRCRWRRRTRRNGSTPACIWAYGIDGPSQGHFYVDFETGKLVEVEVRLRASAAARLLHPVDRRRPRQRRRDHGPVGARGAPVQVRLRHRLELLAAARRGRAARRRRQVVRPDELPQDRRPRGRRHQVGRHHAPRRQDGDRRRRPSRHRAVHRLEGDRGAEGRQPRHRLEDQPEAPARDPEGLRELRRLGRRLLRSREEPGAAARDQGGAQEPRAGQLHQARDPVRQAGLHRHRLPDLRHRLGFGRLSHRLRPELQQLGARHRRVPQGGRSRRRLGPVLAHQARQDRQDREGARAVGEDRPRRLGLRRSRPAVPHHRQRLAHLPGVGADPRVESVLGIHVPRRHRLQSRLDEPARVPRPPQADRTRGPVRRRRLRARGAAVDRRARNLGADGAVPLARDRAALASSSARSGSATPISAAC